MNTSEMMNKLLQVGELHQAFSEEILQVLQYINPATSNTFYNGKGEPFEIVYAYPSDDDYQKMMGLSIRYTAYLVSNSSYEDVSDIVTNCDIGSLKSSFHDVINNSFYQKIAVTRYFHRDLWVYVKDPTFVSAITQKLFFNLYKTDIMNVWRFKVLLLMLNCEDHEQVEAVLDTWKRYDSHFCEVYKLDEYLLDYDWSALFVNDLAKGMHIYEAMNRQVKNYSESCRMEHHDAYQAYGGGEIITRPAYDQPYYGEGAIAWVKNVASSQGCYKKKSSGCVLAGTMIHLFDGDRKPIELLCYGDVIHNVQGCASYLSEELVENADVSYLYAVNDDLPFMSLDHAIMTKRGWCAPDPHPANLVCPEFHVHKLMLGDVIEKLDEQGQPYSITVKRIVIEENRNHINCYDLHVYDGYHSYYANGYPCLLVYPQITLAYLKRRIKALPKDVQRHVIEQLSAIDEIEKAFLQESEMAMVKRMLLKLESEVKSDEMENAS